MKCIMMASCSMLVDLRKIRRGYSVRNKYSCSLSRCRMRCRRDLCFGET